MNSSLEDRSQDISYGGINVNKSVDSQAKQPEKHEDLIYTNMRKLKTGRIIQRNVIYVIGIEDNIASESILSSDEYFGQYGEIVQIFLNKKGYTITDEKKIYYSAYITYNNNYSACLSIIALESSLVPKHKKLRASYASTKYCKFF